MKNRCEENRIEYKNLVRVYKNKCRRDRNKSWHKTTEKIESPKELAKLNKALQSNDKNNINIFEKQDGSFTEPGLDTLTYLIKTHFPAAKTLMGKKFDSKKNILINELETKYTEWINTTLVIEALRGFDNKKSPGPDGLKPVCLLYTSPSPRD